METIEIPKQAFLGLFEGFLNEAGYKLTLIVEELTRERKFSCKEVGCGEPFIAYPPDDEHIIPKLEQIEGAVSRSYKCPKGHVNTVYWITEVARFLMTR